MHIHASRQPGIMNLHALNIMRDQQRPPAVVDLTAVRQKLEIAFDHAGEAICLGDAQTEAVLVSRAGRGVPELAQRLRGVAEPHPLIGERVKRAVDRVIWWVVVSAEAQQNICCRVGRFGRWASVMIPVKALARERFIRK